jgi:hypothetical protein
MMKSRIQEEKTRRWNYIGATTGVFHTLEPRIIRLQMGQKARLPEKGQETGAKWELSFSVSGVMACPADRGSSKGLEKLLNRCSGLVI